MCGIVLKGQKQKQKVSRKSMTTVCLLITLLTSLIVSHQSRVTGIIDKVRKKKNSLWFRRNYFQNVGILSIDSDDRL